MRMKSNNEIRDLARFVTQNIYFQNQEILVDTLNVRLTITKKYMFEPIQTFLSPSSRNGYLISKGYRRKSSFLLTEVFSELETQENNP